MNKQHLAKKRRTAWLYSMASALVALFMLTSFSNSLKAQCTAPPTFPNTMYLGTFGDSYYYKATLPNDVDFNTANNLATSIGGHLPFVKSAAQNTWLKNTVNGSYWLGISDAANEGTWRYLDGTPATYFNWNLGEPNNVGNEDYARTYTNGTWNDQPVHAAAWVVIEVVCCSAGGAAPLLISNNIKNACPSTGIDLGSAKAINLPPGVVLTWHTSAAASNSNKVSNPSSAAPGTYYAAFYDSSNDCYSAAGGATTVVTATLESCCSAGNITPVLTKN